jgi:hypothetical protein
MRTLHPPIRDVRALLDFLAHWCNVPADVPPVDVPEETPPPLSELYERFGSLVAKEWWVRSNLCWSQGLFSGQNFLVAPTRLGKESESAFIDGKSYWLVARENQHCWFARVLAGTVDDARVLPWRATARKYLTSSHSNMDAIMHFCFPPGQTCGCRPLKGACNSAKPAATYWRTGG